ncbi:cyclic nucleotide-binding domain-containing protein (plasmid) [Aliirhizobium terrae]|uniref:cyclic nucleotide-binding domain-containing protein n=1 Tax=Terrirhizobium terrae TaxID=2926709 RepID=UPI002576329F|nr:cyclic nucleotide-binding domain-containing protein [Rhizobium sp. CC-CFT758]WJH37626.1 cyclic nucleotide-binding domain-containing protein [Rhizobium sp. CC-CFT758]
MLSDEVETLREVPIFASIEPAKLKLLAFACDRMTYREGQDICRQGDQGDAAYVLLSGVADVIVSSAAGEVKVAVIGANAVVGEMAVLCNIPRTATVRAVSKLEVLRISKDHFLALTSEFPQVATEIMRTLATRLSRTTAELANARISYTTR